MVIAKNESDILLKPVEIIDRLVKALSYPGSIVLDFLLVVVQRVEFV